MPIAAYVDSAMFGLPLGIGIGRIGCFLIHDHPGTLTHFILGVRYPDGAISHAHGLYISIEGFLMFGLFCLLRMRPSNRPNIFLILFLILDGLTRLFLDFLRINDARYFGLTPSQYAAIGMVLLGIVIAANPKKKPVVV